MVSTDCVFDVSATGDPEVVKSYLQSQELLLRATTTRLDVNKEVAPAGVGVTFTATIAPLGSKRPPPTGTVTFLVDGQTAAKRVALNKRGQARVSLKFKLGAHQIMASYTPSRGSAKAIICRAPARSCCTRR